MARARKKMDHQKMVEAVAAGTKKYLRYDEAAELYSVGVNTIKKWTHDAGAVHKVSGIALVSVKKWMNLLNHLRRFRKCVRLLQLLIRKAAWVRQPQQ